MSQDIYVVVEHVRGEVAEISYVMLAAAHGPRRKHGRQGRGVPARTGCGQAGRRPLGRPGAVHRTSSAGRVHTRRLSSGVDGRDLGGQAACGVDGEHDDWIRHRQRPVRASPVAARQLLPHRHPRRKAAQPDLWRQDHGGDPAARVDRPDHGHPGRPPGGRRAQRPGASRHASSPRPTCRGSASAC